ncbi:uncharacterized protein LOC133193449 [Saccostrea echinata]|uniref:uncharacterized protein LOC133193449 n=1 Tax=Saccostrea echinata TaxID=191078 RepID=UPI002A80D59B|nr:uncharacterized protein LOC133193449 [Saccostrea echinata]
MAFTVYFVTIHVVHLVNLTLAISILENVIMDVNQTGQDTFVTNAMIRTLGIIVLRSAASTAKVECAIISLEFATMDVTLDSSRRLAIKIVTPIVITGATELQAIAIMAVSKVNLVRSVTKTVDLAVFQRAAYVLMETAVAQRDGKRISVQNVVHTFMVNSAK